MQSSDKTSPRCLVVPTEETHEMPPHAEIALISSRHDRGLAGKQTRCASDRNRRNRSLEPAELAVVGAMMDVLVPGTRLGLAGPSFLQVAM